MALFNLLSLPFAFLPLGLSQYAQAKVSAVRILNFLQHEQLEDYVDKSPGDKDEVLAMENVSMSWIVLEEDSSALTNADASKAEMALAPLVEEENKAEDLEVAASKKDELHRSVTTLQNLSFSIKKGSFVAVIGPVGSGKSSLLNGFLGELILTSGRVRAAGSLGAPLSHLNL